MVAGTVSTARSIALAALAIALEYAAAGVHEEGGNNRGDQVEFFQRLMGGAPGDAWCADFVCTCLVKGYARQTGQAEDRAHLAGRVRAASGALIPLSGCCPALAQGARQRYRFRSREFTPAAGDLVLFDFTGQGEPHHVGLVCSADADAIHTVEGNTRAGAMAPSADGRPLSDADGDGVFRRDRPRAHVFGYVHWG